jgi:N-acylneuraminate cytidylyltransferase
MANLAVIPARGGSKRIPNKNTKDFLGQPIIKYSIEVAKSSKLFDEIIVSTDDNSITSLAASFGAGMPFKRSEKNSDDFATLTDVLLEVIESYQAAGKYFEFVCLLLPTAPLISVRSLVEAHQLLTNDSDCSSVVPVVRFSYPVQRAFIVDEQRYLKMLYPQFKFTRSQDLVPAYHDSGQFYWIRVADFLKEKSVFTESTRCLELDELEVQDIDNETDWKLAEIKYSLLHKSHEAES